MPENRLPHLFINGPTNAIRFTSVFQGASNFRVPQRDRINHAAFLQQLLERAWAEAESDYVVSHAVRQGVYLQFKSSPGFDLKIKSLEDMRSRKIRLCNVKKEVEIVYDEQTREETEKEILLATVYIANEKRHFFINKINQYATQEVQSGKPKNADLIDGINDLQKAMARSFWQDNLREIPGTDAKWCEVWLSGETMFVESRFIAVLDMLQIPYKEGRIIFPERIVKLIYVNHNQLESLVTHSDDIAEFRSAKVTADFWIRQTNRDQAEWVQDLINRLDVNRDSLQSICILDTGINNGHPLLNPLLDDLDCHTVNQEWDVHDHKGHGTLMAGIAALGNIQNHFESTERIEVPHVLESVKILPPEPNHTDPNLWGDITNQGISRAEIHAPHRKRVICMSATSMDNIDHGRPSSWSGALDQICSGSEDGNKRLFIVSVGNYSADDIREIANYPTYQANDSVHDPAQSWNALSVGAYTQLTNITDPTLNGYRPIADVNQISPFSTTSLSWNDEWPIKPEVVFEGGNAVVDDRGFVSTCDDLSLISTFYQPNNQYFKEFMMTSAATAQAANFAAKIQAVYPHYWSETIRGLIVHSAEWPQELKAQFARNNLKGELKKVLRACGYGVPDFERATNCASNSLTLISQAEIQPYEYRNGRVCTKDMHFYSLPWPREILLDLGDIEVEMRITLSYFIEPGPGEVGWKDRYRYPSHLLRFDINSPGESQDEFLRRINAALRNEENGNPETPSASDHWLIGSQRNKGSIHSDIWKGTSADLATSNMIAVSPRIGWWRERKHLGKCESQTRYTIIVSIKTARQDIDIYTPVATQIHSIVSIPTRF